MWVVLWWRGGVGCGQGQPGLPRPTGWTVGSEPGDMMMDWVAPACGGAAAQSLEAVRVSCTAGAV